MADEPVFRVRGLEKRYGERTVLAGLDFDLWPSECFVVLGRSGSGKSVTLRQLNGLERPDAGSIRYHGEEITLLDERSLYPLRRQVAMLFQSGALFDSMSVLDNVAFPLREHTDWSAERIRARVAETLALVGLPKIESSFPSDLSGGMRKRVALARSLALAPEAILYDEPTTGLDPMTGASIAHLVRATQRELGVASIVVTHDLALARHVGDRLGFLDNGRFAFVGTWQEADSSAAPSHLRHFLAGEREEDDE